MSAREPVPSGPLSVPSPAAMEALGERWGAVLLRQIAATPSSAASAHDAPWSGVVLGLEGDLGAGKTTFVRGLVRGVTGLNCVVTSPTFQLMNLYRPELSGPPGARTLAHIDAYRLTTPAAFWELGVADLLDEGAVLAVEWPSRTRHPVFEADALILTFAHQDDHTRQVALARRPPGWEALSLTAKPDDRR